MNLEQRVAELEKRVERLEAAGETAKHFHALGDSDKGLVNDLKELKSVPKP